MRTRYRTIASALAAAFLLVNFTITDVAGQQKQKRKILIIRGIEVHDIRTPIYEVKPNFKSDVKEWKQIEVEYATDPDWIDELTFTYYVLLKNKKRKATPENPRAAYTLLKGDVTNVNIPKDGTHWSVMYLHPSTLARYGDINRVAVVATHEGATEAVESLPKGKKKSRWWEEVTPMEGLLLNRLESPYAVLVYDRYEAIKTGARGKNP